MGRNAQGFCPVYKGKRLIFYASERIRNGRKEEIKSL